MQLLFANQKRFKISVYSRSRSVEVLDCNLTPTDTAGKIQEHHFLQQGWRFRSSFANYRGS